MPKISELPSVISLDINDVLAIVSKDNDNNATTMKVLVSALANKLNNNIQYAALNTSNDTIVGAINELEARSTYTEVTGTLLTGATSITLSDASITTSSFIQVFAGNGNINYTSISVATGSVTIGFLAQASDMTVTVRIS